MMPIIHGIVTNTINKSPGRKKLEKGVPANNDDDSVNGYSGRIIKIIPTPNAEKQIIERNKICNVFIACKLPEIQRAVYDENSLV